MLHSKSHYSLNCNYHRQIAHSSKGKNVDKPSERIQNYAPPLMIPTQTASEATSRIVAAPKGCALPDGLASLGTQALHMKVHVHSLDQPPMKGQLDSGVDIMLMSEEYWESIPKLPKPKEGP